MVRLSKKHYTLMILSVLMLLVGYSISWFFISKQIETKTAYMLSSLDKSTGIDSVSYNLKVSGFPFINVEISEIYLKTQKYYAKSKLGHEITIFKQNPLKFTIKNIFNPSLNLKLKNAVFDMTFKNLDNNLPISFYLTANNLEFYIKANQLGTKLHNVSLQTQVLNNPTRHLADALGIAFNYNISANNLVNMQAMLNTHDLKLFSPKTGLLFKTVDHSKFKASLENLDFEMLNNLHQLYKKDKLQTTKKIIQSIADNKTMLNISDFRYTDEEQQFLSSANLGISSQLLLTLDANLDVRFRKNNTSLEKMIQSANFVKNEHNSYRLTIGSFGKMLKINNGLAIPRPNFAN